MKVKYRLHKKAPILFTLLAVAGIGASCYFTAKSTKKAVKKIEAKEEELGRELETTEKVKEVAVDYIPAIAAGAMTIACVMGLEETTKRKIVALTTSYGALQAKYEKFKNETEKRVGSEKVNEIIDKIEEKTKIPKRKSPEGTDKERICVETPIGDLWFESNLIDVMNGKFLINDSFFKNGYIALDEICQIWGIECNDTQVVKRLPEIGWDWEGGQEFFGYDNVDFNLIEKDPDKENRYYIIRWIQTPHPIFVNYDEVIMEHYGELKED